MLVLAHQLVCSKRSLDLFFMLSRSGKGMNQLAQPIYFQLVEKSYCFLGVYDSYLSLHDACANQWNVFCNTHIIIMNERVNIVIRVPAELRNLGNLRILPNN